MQINAIGIECFGVSESDSDIQGLMKHEHWSVQRQIWQRQLEALAQEFKEGYCQPKPIREHICLQCDYQNLCRKEFI